MALQASNFKFSLKNFNLTKNLGNNKRDKALWTNDQQSMRDFIQDINHYEGRFKMFEKWYKRKETEIKQRGLLAIRALIKPDKELHRIFKSKWSRKYRGHCEKVFGQDYDKISVND